VPWTHLYFPFETNSRPNKRSLRLLVVMNAASRALSYCAEKPNMATTYHACDMILTVFVDASYLSPSMARSVVGCIFFLGNRHQPTRINGTISAISTIIPCIVSSADEAEYTGSIHRRSTCCWAPHHLNRYGIPAAAHYDSMRQHICHWTSKPHHQAEAQQDNRHEISLDSRSYSP
jgi:hypothetical protein